MVCGVESGECKVQSVVAEVTKTNSVLGNIAFLGRF